MLKKYLDRVGHSTLPSSQIDIRRNTKYPNPTPGCQVTKRRFNPSSFLARRPSFHSHLHDFPRIT